MDGNTQRPDAKKKQLSFDEYVSKRLGGETTHTFGACEYMAIVDIILFTTLLKINGKRIIDLFREGIKRNKLSLIHGKLTKCLSLQRSVVFSNTLHRRIVKDIQILQVEKEHVYDYEIQRLWSFDDHFEGEMVENEEYAFQIGDPFVIYNKNHGENQEFMFSCYVAFSTRNHSITKSVPCMEVIHPYLNHAQSGDIVSCPMRKELRIISIRFALLGLAFFDDIAWKNLRDRAPEVYNRWKWMEIEEGQVFV